MRSFDPDPSVIATASHGQRVHQRSLEHSARLMRTFYTVREGVWSLVGNGLSNQAFIEGPEGIIAIDTGGSCEEMTSALTELRAHTRAPIVAVIYTHFHYVNGTRAVFADAGRDLSVYGHERIGANRARVSTEIAPAYTNGIIHQLGLRLPTEGADGLVNVGLSQFVRNPVHAPFTPGHLPVTVAWRGGEATTIAGLDLQVTHAPSDADDSVTLWFPALGVCVQNLVWPTLFNIFAIRGEAYRDPQVLLTGIDHILGLAPEHLIATHGPPISGRDQILARTTRYRDTIQFLWDQTVRGMNRGRTVDELAHSVVLPASADNDYLTTEFYGVAEHHVRQIAMGVRGWFDGDTAKLFPLEPVDRAGRMVKGFGGEEAVRAQAIEARASNELRWALELATWLVVRAEATTVDRQLLAEVLRDIGYRTTAANIRNWCITRARDLDGSTDLSGLREHHLLAPALAARTPRELLNLLRVLLDPARCAGIDHHIAFHFAEAPAAGLHVRNCVSVATDGHGATSVVKVSYEDLVKVLAGQRTLSEGVAAGHVRIEGNVSATRTTLAAFDIPGLRG